MSIPSIISGHSRPLASQYTLNRSPAPRVRFGCGSDSVNMGKDETNKSYTLANALKKFVWIPFVVIPQLFQSTAVKTTHKALAPDETRITEHLTYLTGAARNRSHPYMPRLENAATYITQVLSHDGVNYTEQAYQASFEAKGETFKNIIVSFGPKNAERIVVGAHYDVCLTEYPNQGPKPGADDNATGVAGLLEMARLLKSQESKLTKRIDLVFFANEEPPFFRTKDMGSYRYAELLRQEKVKVAGMIALDMIGYFSDEPNSQKLPPIVASIPVVNSIARWLLSPNKESKGNFIAVTGDLGSINFAKRIRNGINKHSTVPAASFNLPNHVAGLPTMVDFSDHQNFNEDYRAVMLTDTSVLRNPNYHTDKDTIDTLNIPKMCDVIKGLNGTLLNL